MSAPYSPPSRAEGRVAAALLAESPLDAETLAPGAIPDSARTYADRFYLRLMSLPAAAACLRGDRWADNGRTLEVEFDLMPDEPTEAVRQLFGPHTKVKVFRYRKGSSPRVGFRVQVPSGEPTQKN